MLQGQLANGQPGYVATVLADKVAGLTGVYAILAALLHRERTGRGQEVEIGMFETLVSFLMVEHLCGSLWVPPIGPPAYSRVISPMRKPYRTADGFISVMIYNDRQWQKFADLIGNPLWMSDARFKNLKSRTDHIHEVYTALAGVFAGHTTSEWLALLETSELPAMPLLTTADLLCDPHLMAVGFWEQEGPMAARMRFPGIPTRFARTPGRITHPGPALGEHTDAVLMELGMNEEAIARLRRRGVFGAAPSQD
jgi:crotonobetainyl-CoA:carnitine CoA-transferase CaiB-like acyl-CoA transferase